LLLLLRNTQKKRNKGTQTKTKVKKKKHRPWAEQVADWHLLVRTSTKDKGRGEEDLKIRNSS